MKKIIFSLIVSIIFFNLSTYSANANHSWGNYHWARTTNPFSLKLGDNLSLNWKPFLSTTSTDWSQSTVLDANIVIGQGRKNCSPTSGQIEVCNKKYGNNGWLGIAQIWINGNHITQGVTKLNDTYFLTNKYNTNAWKNLVMCQEVGHTLGLDHQDEVFDNTNLNTCMDYTNNPQTNQHPNAHDYEELESIYLHLDGFTTLSQFFGQTTKQIVHANLDEVKNWGKLISNNGKLSKYERDLGFGNKVLTHVIWAD